MANPCFCGCSLKKSCVTIATINMIESSLLFYVTLIGGAVLIGFGDTAASEEAWEYNVLFWAEFGVGAAITFIIVFLIVFVLLFYFALTLRRGAEQENLKKCRIWFNVTAILFVILRIIKMIPLGFVVLPLLYSFTRFLILDNEVYIFGCLAGFGLVYNVFSLWVVYEFMNTLKTRQVIDTVASYNVGETGNTVNLD